MQPWFKQCTRAFITPETSCTCCSLFNTCCLWQLLLPWGHNYSLTNHLQPQTLPMHLYWNVTPVPITIGIWQVNSQRVMLVGLHQLISTIGCLNVNKLKSKTTFSILSNLNKLRLHMTLYYIVPILTIYWSSTISFMKLPDRSYSKKSEQSLKLSLYCIQKSKLIQIFLYLLSIPIKSWFCTRGKLWSSLMAEEFSLWTTHQTIVTVLQRAHHSGFVAFFGFLLTACIFLRLLQFLFVHSELNGVGGWFSSQVVHSRFKTLWREADILFIHQL